MSSFRRFLVLIFLVFECSKSPIQASKVRFFALLPTADKKDASSAEKGLRLAIILLACYEGTCKCGLSM